MSDCRAQVLCTNIEARGRDKFNIVVKHVSLTPISWPWHKFINLCRFVILDISFDIYLYVFVFSLTYILSWYCFSFSLMWTMYQCPWWLIHPNGRKGQNEYLLTNSSWHSNAFWPTLDQVMACCLTASSYYLNQCWLITSQLLWHSSEGKLTQEMLKITILAMGLNIITLRLQSHFPYSNASENDEIYA